VGVYIDWTKAPSYAIRDPAPVLDWLEKGTDEAIPRQDAIYFGMAIIALCEEDIPARAGIPVLIFLLHVQT